MDKKQKLVEIKSIDSEKKIITLYVSTYEWDRMDERFVKGAWDIKNYLKNPVILWLHNTDHAVDKLPIGRTLSLAEDDQGLFKQIQFDKENEFAMRVFSAYERGFLNSFSVGFIPKKYQMDDMGEGRKGITWTDAELLESSAVPIPANPGATMDRECADLMQKLLGDKFDIKSFENADEFVLVEKDDVEVPLEVTLKSLIELARMAKGKDMDENKISLVKTSIKALEDIILEKEEPISEKEFGDLKAMVDQLATIVKAQSSKPDVQGLVSKFLIQLEIATRNYGKK